MNHPSQSSRILLLADRRAPARGPNGPVTRYRLARVAPGVRQATPAPRLADPKAR
ncbi:MAG: hypothetical protein WAL63_11175 [Solirubrobacteraceae bacterium]